MVRATFVRFSLFTNNSPGSQKWEENHTWNQLWNGTRNSILGCSTGQFVFIWLTVRSPYSHHHWSVSLHVLILMISNELSEVRSRWRWMNEDKGTWPVPLRFNRSYVHHFTSLLGNRRETEWMEECVKSTLRLRAVGGSNSRVQFLSSDCGARSPLRSLPTVTQKTESSEVKRPWRRTMVNVRYELTTAEWSRTNFPFVCSRSSNSLHSCIYHIRNP